MAGDKITLLSSDALQFMTLGALFAAARGETEWPHRVYKVYWPLWRAPTASHPEALARH